jgi:hypothetical protein
VHNYPNMLSLPRHWIAPLVSFFLVLTHLGAQEQDRDLPPAQIGAVYAHPLATNRPAYFEKSAGDAAWLTVNHDGVLTGTPPSDAPPRAGITVTAYALDASGHPDVVAEPLVRSFVVPVEKNSCAAAYGSPLVWCNAPAAAPAADPPQKSPQPVFSPKNLAPIQIKALDGHTAEVLSTDSCDDANGCILQFHRLRGVEGDFGYFDPHKNQIIWKGYPLIGDLEMAVINAINASKVLVSGSVFIYEHVNGCSQWSWSVVTQTVESSNNLVYEPSDLTYFCTQSRGKETVLIVLPVHAIWASAYPRYADTKDPTWRPHEGPPKALDCSGDTPESRMPPQGIRPCDVDTNTPIRRRTGWVYNRLALPGVSQGSISVAPIMPATKSTWDVQLYTSTLLGYGWAGLQLMYEHDRKSSDDLNSLTAALSYDVRIPRQPTFWTQWGSHKADRWNRKCGLKSNGDCTPPYIGLRPPELNLRFGPEYSPDAFSYTPKNGSTMALMSKPKNEVKQYLPRDLNLIGAATLRLPIIISPQIGDRQEPSQITIAPVVGLEGGMRMISDGILTAMPCPFSQPPQCTQPQSIFRRVGGFDASARWPYNWTKNFLGDRPITVDYSYRIRWLTYEEPFSNQMWVIRDNDIAAFIAANTASPVASENLPPDKWPTLIPASGQSLGARIYQRITFIAPFSAYLQLRATWQHGALPPVFQYVGNEVTLGLAFSNPGSSEH